MKYSEWLELLGEKREQILNEAVDAYKDSLESTHLRFIVELDCNGDIYTWYDIAGGNSTHVSTYKGDSIECIRICNEYLSINISDESIIRYLTEQKKTEYISILEAEQAEDYTSYECLISDHHLELRPIVEQCIADEKEFLCDNCREQLEYELDEFINQCERYAECEEAAERGWC